ncbi:hypothetical protein F8M41_011584 [Gigaspora margarita]|uniref:Uncharacterized protein n=1 Tax=Gigaspora margarita TaxID=4874 RepID=A0A8H4A0F5_GIGMA|nr:hypothetical protein F8M41_011584 [Gigaspora margarita]
MNFKRRACGYGSGSETEKKIEEAKQLAKVGPAFHLLLICHQSLTEECTHGLEMSGKAKASEKICFELCASYRYWDVRSYLWIYERKGLMMINIVLNILFNQYAIRKSICSY